MQSLPEARDGRFTLIEQPAKRKSIYYGWVIVSVGFLAQIASEGNKRSDFYFYSFLLFVSFIPHRHF
jgi:hypothetical protein